MRLFYIGFFADEQNIQNRKVSLSAVNKMKYIMSVIKNDADEVIVVSCSGTNNDNIYHGSTDTIDRKIILKQFFTFGRKTVLNKVLDRVFIKLQLLFFLISTTSKNDIVLVYHSIFYCRILRTVHRIKRWRLILELEEIYADVTDNKRQRVMETKMCKDSDGFVFPTHLLSDVINTMGKPNLVIHGTYSVEEERIHKADDGKIHVVYAGTFDPRKGGSIAAAAAAEFLDENYHIHILGFGSNLEKEQLLRTIEEIKKKSKCGLTYDGLLKGEEYIRFIQSCEIGLSTQNPDAAFNSTSFPSKVLSYMANGLRVVSIRIQAVKSSAVGDLITYYDEQTPQCIADAIRSVNFSIPYDSRKRIKELDTQFQIDIRKLIEAVNEID